MVVIAEHNRNYCDCNIKEFEVVSQLESRHSLHFPTIYIKVCNVTATTIAIKNHETI
jgi:hypothetical protein